MVTLIVCSFPILSFACRDVRSVPELGQIGPKWDKYGLLKDQFKENYGSASKNNQKVILNSIGFVNFAASGVYNSNLLSLLCNFLSLRF